MTCKAIVYLNGVQYRCDEPDLIPGYCHDHCRPCDICNEPIPPHDDLCDKCQKIKDEH
jgi:hypothetical protein